MDRKNTMFARLMLTGIVTACLLFSGLEGTGKADNYLTLLSEPGIQTKYPQQMELEEFERFAKKKLAFKENPVFKDQVKKGSLPPVTKRLPDEPLIVIPGEKIGKYGGILRGMALSYESGTAEILSWRQANFVRFSDDNKTIVPNVVKSWEWSLDYRQITFFLRKGHRWSDGEPFTADDVVFWLNDIILNKEIHPQTPRPWQNVNARAEKIDTHTVRLVFEKPFTALLFYLGGSGSYYDPFAPKHFLKKFHVRYNPDVREKSVSNGYANWVEQFKTYWDKWKDAIVNKASGMEVPTLESHILVEIPDTGYRKFIANPYYFKVDTAGNQLPYITYHLERFLPKNKWVDEIIAGRVDQKSQNMSLVTYPVLKENQEKGGFELQTPITGVGPVLLFNKTHKDPAKRKVFSDPRFNWAVSLSIKRERINDTLFLGLCRPGQALPQNVGFAIPEDTRFMADHDPEKANTYLNEMGLRKGPDGFRTDPFQNPLTINWEYSLQYVWSPDLPLMIKEDLAAVGLRVELKEVSTKEARKKQMANDLDISSEWVAPFEPTLFASPILFMPPFGEGYPVMGIPWWEWKNSNGKRGEEPPLWVKNLWQVGEEFVTLVPGSDWYNALGRKMIKLNFENLNIIGTLSDVPLVTIVSNKLGNIPRWRSNSYHYGYAYPYRADQWYFK